MPLLGRLLLLLLLQTKLRLLLADKLAKVLLSLLHLLLQLQLLLLQLLLLMTQFLDLSDLVANGLSAIASCRGGGGDIIPKSTSSVTGKIEEAGREI